MSESDSEFLDRIHADRNGIIYENEFARLFALARKGAEVDAENARLREALEEYACTCEAGTCAEKDGFRDWPCGGPARDASTPPPEKENADGE